MIYPGATRIPGTFMMKFINHREVPSSLCGCCAKRYLPIPVLAVLKGRVWPCWIDASREKPAGLIAQR